MSTKRTSETDTPALPEAEADSLPELTGKQMRFVEGVVSGKSASEAYRDAYDASGMSATSVSGEASKMRHDPKVAAWIRAFFVAHLGAGVLTLEGHLRELEAIRELGKDQGDLKTAVAAEHLRGKASGLYTERSQVTVNVEPIALVTRIAAISREVGLSLAKQFNLTVPALMSDPVEDAQVIEGEGLSAGHGQPLGPADLSDDEPRDDQAGSTQGNA